MADDPLKPISNTLDKKSTTLTSKDGKKLYPLMSHASGYRDRIREYVKRGIEDAFPVEGSKYKLELENTEIDEQVFSKKDQKDAKMRGSSLTEPVKADVKMVDKETGEEVDRSKRTMAHVPYFTENHTFLMGGNEYSVDNQVRVKPGVYTRKRRNDKIESSFNLGKGRNFRVDMDPEKGVFNMQYGTSKIPLYSVLKEMGMSDKQIENRWGKELTEVNRNKASGKQKKHLNKLYKKVVPEWEREEGASRERKQELIKESFEDTQMDPDVNKRTIGSEKDTVDKDALAKASEKILRVFNNEEETDDRDSIEFKELRTPETHFKERIDKSATPNLYRRVKKKLNQKKGDKSIGDIMPTAPFSKPLERFITTSSLSNTPMQINPLELVDKATKVTSMGEGGISSTLAVPDQARDVHPSHMGVIDPVRTPENQKAGVNIRGTSHVARDDDGKMYAPVIAPDKDPKEVSTDGVDYIPVDESTKSNIAFPDQDFDKGEVDVISDEGVEKVNVDDVDYKLAHSSAMYSPTTNMVPFIDSAQGNRNVMAAKMQTQALPLKNADTPNVQTKSWREGRTMEEEFGNMIVPTSPVAGKVEDVDDEYIYIRPDNKKEGSSDRMSATVIKGNPEHVEGDNEAEKYYRQIADYLRSHGFDVTLDPGEAHTVPSKNDDLWVGHSRGAGRLRFAPDPVKTIPFSTPEEDSYTHPKDRKLMQEQDDYTPVKEHYQFTDEQKRAIDQAANEIKSSKSASASGLSLDQIALGYVYKEGADDQRYDDLVKVPRTKNFPLMSKTYIDDEVKVSKGDRVSEGDVLADNNFTEDGSIAVGKNMKTAYVPYYGANSNDAIVMSESGAKKMTSQHMYTESLNRTDDTVLDKQKHRAEFGPKYSAAEYSRLDADGVIKEGENVESGELLIAAMVKSKNSHTAQMLGKLHKSLRKPYRDKAVTWDHDHPGTVTDVTKTDGQITVAVRTDEPMREGDKISGRFGNKGVVSRIVPDDQMLKDENDDPIDVALTSAGVITRINPSQVLETAVGKVAEKTGEKIAVGQYEHDDNVQWAKDKLKEHGMSDKETIYDPKEDKEIPNIHVGNQHMFKLFKSTDTNFSARGVGPGYDSNMQPTSGGEEGAKSMGKMEATALMAHDARNLLQESAVVRGQKNDEYWKRHQLGLPTKTPNENFAHDKFLHMLKGSGIDVSKEGSKRILGPMTNKKIDEMADREITEAKTAKTKTGKGTEYIEPEEGGLFDPKATGGLDGDRYAKFELDEPVVNPVFEDSARRLLGMTKSEFRKVRDEKGADYIRKELNKIDKDQKIKDLKQEAKNKSGYDRDDKVKQVKYLQSLKKENTDAGDAYVLDKLPVTPPKVRPLIPTPERTLVSDANYLYKDAIRANRAFEEMPNELMNDEEKKKNRKHLHESVGALFGTREPVSPKNKGRAKGHLKQIIGKNPKSGYFQSKMLKKRQDLTGRGTITPDHTLGMDEIGMPEDMAWKMYEPHVMKRLVKQGYDATEAKKKVENKEESARNALLSETKERPVLFNRAPTLHRWNMISAYPKLISGKTLRINPFAEDGMNADYDGDAIQLHTPVSEEAKKEAQSMTLDNLLFGDKKKDSLMIFPSHEAVIGNYMATKDKENRDTVEFDSEEEAKRAYKKGDITMSTPVKINN